MKTFIFTVLFTTVFCFPSKDDAKYEGEPLCDSSMGDDTDIFCMNQNFILKALGSKSSFFGDALNGYCWNAKEKLYEEVQEIEEHMPAKFLDDHKDDTCHHTLDIKCSHEHEIVTRMKICEKDTHVLAIRLYCGLLKEPERIMSAYNISSDATGHTSINCGNNGALHGIYLMNSGFGTITRMVASCIKIDANYDKESIETKNII